MTAVCSHAGLTERYFYESFADRTALLDSIFDATAKDIAADLSAAIGAATTPAARSSAAVGSILDQFTSDTRFRRIAVNSEQNGTLSRMRYVLARNLSTSLEQHASDLWTTNGNRTRLSIACMAGIAAIAEPIAAWARGILEIDRATLVLICGGVLISTGQAVFDADSSSRKL
ncbi:hypothetical protein CH306_25975 [Rhodococcus sp. 15-725-2-2b]|nr:hypothetical protein CH277_22685 [Rhodococcus sp. 06-469-3-2]OZD40815.1 hypothetical protein CH264_24370 [Rhodococcus sp. 06-1477-1A]OZE67077.1 hypothetical protein CH306_25975 [Rhodococcus sp. 15-725-2-2b]